MDLNNLEADGYVIQWKSEFETFAALRNYYCYKVAYVIELRSNTA